MVQDLQFDIAFSYAAEDSWIAKDIYKLVAQGGLSVYCYDLQPGRAAGFLRENLRDIYRTSRLNVLFWSEDYAARALDAITAMERRALVNRHIELGESKTLFIVQLDRSPLHADISSVLALNIRQFGMFGLARLLAERIAEVTSARNETGLVQHPESTEGSRTRLHPCVFEIDPKFQAESGGRWERLADVLVKLPNPLGTRYVYLIPSGACSPLLRHPDILRADPDLLNRKRDATLAWVKQQGSASVRGFWFGMRKGEHEFATVYAPGYDAALNSSLAGAGVA